MRNTRRIKIWWPTRPVSLRLEHIAFMRSLLRQTFFEQDFTASGPGLVILHNLMTSEGWLYLAVAIEHLLNGD